MRGPSCALTRGLSEAAGSQLLVVMGDGDPWLHGLRRAPAWWPRAGRLLSVQGASRVPRLGTTANLRLPPSSWPRAVACPSPLCVLGCVSLPVTSPGLSRETKTVFFFSGGGGARRRWPGLPCRSRAELGVLHVCGVSRRAEPPLRAPHGGRCEKHTVSCPGLGCRGAAFLLERAVSCSSLHPLGMPSSANSAPEAGVGGAWGERWPWRWDPGRPPRPAMKSGRLESGVTWSR